MLLAVEPVHHLVAGRHLAAVVHGGALLLGRGVGIPLLHLLLNLVAGIAARRRSGYGCEGFTAAAANLVAQEAPHHGADTRAHQAIAILHRLGPRHLHLVAVLPGSPDRPVLGRHADHLGAARGADDAIAGARAGGRHHEGTDHEPGYG